MTSMLTYYKSSPFSLKKGDHFLKKDLSSSVSLQWHEAEHVLPKALSIKKNLTNKHNCSMSVGLSTAGDIYLRDLQSAQKSLKTSIARTSILLAVDVFDGFIFNR